MGEFGPRVPFYVAAGISALNLVYGWFVLPETLAPENRRPFDWRRANPFGAFRVFRRYPGVIPMCGVLALFFFATAVYPAVWSFWGIAKFGWSEGMIGLTLAAFGLIVAGFQGGLTGVFVRLFGEHASVLIGLVCAVIVAVGYGTVTAVPVVFLLMLVHGPEGFVHPMLTAMMSKVVPEDAQGELQGGLSALTNLAMLAGTVTFAQVFGHFWAEDRAFRTPNAAFWLAAACLFLTLILFLVTVRRGAGQQGG